jgi:peroxiredoxin Q/BCP
MMAEVALNKTVPDFSLLDQHGKEVSLSKFSGKRVVLYFYPKDNTSGCSLEAEGFRDLKDEFADKNTVIIGVSKDTQKSHAGFSLKLDLNFSILSDKNGEIHQMFDVIKPKKMYGREYLGTERSTFIIDEKGILIKEYRGVKAKGHAEEVLDFISNLK